MARLRLSQDHREKEAAANAEYARKTAADQVILLITHVNSMNLIYRHGTYCCATYCCARIKLSATHTPLGVKSGVKPK